MAVSTDVLERIADDPRYLGLVRRRDRFARTLAAIIILAYFGFVLIVAFDKALLGRRVWGEATSLGIPVGLGIIALAIVLTALYVRRANREFDGEVAALVDGVAS